MHILTGTVVPRASYEMLKLIYRQSHVLGLVTGFSSIESLSTLNRFLKSGGICDVPLAKHYRHVDEYVFLFGTAFGDRVCGE